jgi:hypothetical protein
MQKHKNDYKCVVLSAKQEVRALNETNNLKSHIQLRPFGVTR